jgi:hypothetical protein
MHARKNNSNTPGHTDCRINSVPPIYSCDNNKAKPINVTVTVSSEIPQIKYLFLKKEYD